MASSVKKSLFQLHRWLGVHVSLLLFVICMTGTLATLGYQLEGLLDSAWRADSSEMNWEAIEARLAQDLPHEWAVVIAAPAESGLVATAVIDSPRGQRRIALLDPASGALQGIRSSLTTQGYLRQFHKALLLPKGLLFYGVISFVLFFFAVSGLIIYRRWWANLFQLRLSANPRVRWQDLHRTLGVWVSVFAIVASVTSAWYLVDGLGRFGHDKRAPGLTKARLTQLEGAKRVPLAKLVDAAQAALPGFEVRSIYLPMNPGDPLCTYGQSGAWLVDDRATEVCLDAYSGAVTHIRRPDQLGKVSWWKHTVDELHYGSLGALGGLWSKLLYFVLGLCLSLVVLAGPMLAALRAQASKRTPRRNWASALGVLVILWTGGLLAGSAFFSLETLRQPARQLGPTPDAISAPVRAAGTQAVVARYGQGESAEYRVHWGSTPAPFEKIELVPAQGEATAMGGWRRPSARRATFDDASLRLSHFSGTSTMTARLALGPLPEDGSAPFGLLSPPSRVEGPVKAVAGFILVMIAIACAGWIWVLWRSILLPRRE